MSREELLALYGTADEREILRRKSGGERWYAPRGEAVESISLTAEECRKLCKAAGVEYLPGYEARVLQYRITDESVDRYGDIVLAKGVDITNFKRNPVIQFAHDYSSPPVGTALKTWREDNAWFSWGLFVGNEVDPTGRAESVFRLARSKVMRACSIGFMPKEVTRPASDEEREKLGLGPYGVMFKRSDLMEWSPCPVPANPNAVEAAVKAIRDAKVEPELLARAHKLSLLDDEWFSQLTKQSAPVFPSVDWEELQRSLSDEEDVGDGAEGAVPDAPDTLQAAAAQTIQPIININLDIDATLAPLRDAIAELRAEVAGLAASVHKARQDGESDEFDVAAIQDLFVKGTNK